MVVFHSARPVAEVVADIAAVSATDLAKLKWPKRALVLGDPLPCTFSRELAKPLLRRRFPEAPVDAVAVVPGAPAPQSDYPQLIERRPPVPEPIHRRSATRRVSYCRLCASSCEVLLDIEDGRITRVLGDASHPISHGYTCPKSRRAGDLSHGPERLATSLRRTGDTFEPLSVAVATAEIARSLRDISGRHGPDSIARFMGTQQNSAALTPPMAKAWFRGTGSHKLFSTMTIDQSAKWIAAERMGRYLGGRQRFEDADVWLFAGTNPMVSGNGADGDGAVVQNPSVTLRAARPRGSRLIVVQAINAMPTLTAIPVSVTRIREEYCR